MMGTCRPFQTGRLLIFRLLKFFTSVCKGRYSTFAIVFFYQFNTTKNTAPPSYPHPRYEDLNTSSIKSSFKFTNLHKLCCLGTTHLRNNDYILHQTRPLYCYLRLFSKNKRKDLIYILCNKKNNISSKRPYFFNFK